jgi:hypothetical protein
VTDRWTSLCARRRRRSSKPGLIGQESAATPIWGARVRRGSALPPAAPGACPSCSAGSHCDATTGGMCVPSAAEGASCKFDHECNSAVC